MENGSEMSQNHHGHFNLPTSSTYHRSHSQNSGENGNAEMQIDNSDTNSYGTQTDPVKKSSVLSQTNAGITRRNQTDKINMRDVDTQTNLKTSQQNQINSPTALSERSRVMQRANISPQSISHNENISGVTYDNNVQQAIEMDRQRKALAFNMRSAISPPTQRRELTYDRNVQQALEMDRQKKALAFEQHNIHRTISPPSHPISHIRNRSRSPIERNTRREITDETKAQKAIEMEHKKKALAFEQYKALIHQNKPALKAVKKAIAAKSLTEKSPYNLTQFKQKKKKEVNQSAFKRFVMILLLPIKHDGMLCWKVRLEMLQLQVKQ